MDVYMDSFLVLASYIPPWQKISRIKIRTLRFIMSKKRLISSILICLVVHRKIGWRGLFGVAIDHGRLPQYSRTSFPQPRENDVDWLRENKYFNILYYFLFPSGIRIYLLLQIQLKSFSQLNQDFNCFPFTSEIVFSFSSKSRFIISFTKRSMRNSIPINNLYREVDYCYVLLLKACQRGFLYYFAYQPSVLMELKFSEELQ